MPCFLVIAHQDGSTLAQPCQRPFDHPATGWIALLGVLVQLLLADPAHGGDVLVIGKSLAPRWVIISLLACPGPWDWRRPGPPQTGFAHRCVRGLPSPVHPAERVTIAYQDSPDAIENLPFNPALECAMHRTVLAEPLGQLVPLDTAAQPTDDPIQGTALVDPLAPPVLRGITFRQNWRDLRPRLIRYPPDCRQRFRAIVSFAPGHPFLPHHQGSDAIGPQN